MPGFGEKHTQKGISVHISEKFRQVSGNQVTGIVIRGCGRRFYLQFGLRNAPCCVPKGPVYLCFGLAFAARLSQESTIPPFVPSAAHPV